MAAVFAWCKDGGQAPTEIEAARLIDRFGAQAVYGRSLGVREMRRIMLAERVERIARHGLDASRPDDNALLGRLADDYKARKLKAAQHDSNR